MPYMYFYFWFEWGSFLYQLDQVHNHLGFFLLLSLWWVFVKFVHICWAWLVLWLFTFSPTWRPYQFSLQSCFAVNHLSCKRKINWVLTTYYDFQQFRWYLITLSDFFFVLEHFFCFMKVNYHCTLLQYSVMELNKSSFITFHFPLASGCGGRKSCIKDPLEEMYQWYLQVLC